MNYVLIHLPEGQLRPGHVIINIHKVKHTGNYGRRDIHRDLRPRVDPRSDWSQGLKGERVCVCV